MSRGSNGQDSQSHFPSLDDFSCLIVLSLSDNVRCCLSYRIIQMYQSDYGILTMRVISIRITVAVLQVVCETNVAVGGSLKSLRDDRGHESVLIAYSRLALSE